MHHKILNLSGQTLRKGTDLFEHKKSKPTFSHIINLSTTRIGPLKYCNCFVQAFKMDLYLKRRVVASCYKGGQMQKMHKVGLKLVLVLI